MSGSTQFVLNFDYIDREDIHVSVNAQEAEFSWVSDTVIDVPSATYGSTVVIWRETKRDKRFVDFTVDLPSSEELDLDSRQLFFCLQEAFDGATGGLNLNNLNQYDAGGRNLSNVADPLKSTDVATRGWCLTFADGQMAKAQGYANEARTNYLLALDQKNVVKGLHAEVVTLHASMEDIQAQVDSVDASEAAAIAAKNLALSYRDDALAAKLICEDVAADQQELATQIDTWTTEANAIKVSVDAHLDATEAAADVAGAVAVTAKVDAVTAKTEAETARDTAKQWRDEAEVIRNSLSNMTFEAMFEVDIDGALMPIVNLPPTNELWEADTNGDIMPKIAPA